MSKNKRIKPIERSKNPIADGVDIGHVHLKTANIDRVHDFYVDILGFDVIAKIPNAIFLSSGGYHHHLAFNTWESENGDKPALGTTGLYHVAIRYPTRSLLADALLRLSNSNWPIQGISDHGTHQALYLEDPDGNGLELYWDRPQLEWPIDESGELKMTNKTFDLDELLKEASNK
jgi:catechol 2,3-dioxygenase